MQGCIFLRENAAKTADMAGHLFTRLLKRHRSAYWYDMTEMILDRKHCHFKMQRVSPKKIRTLHEGIKSLQHNFTQTIPALVMTIIHLVNGRKSPFPRRFLRLSRRITARAINATNNSAPKEAAAITAVEPLLSSCIPCLLGTVRRVVDSEKKGK